MKKPLHLFCICILLTQCCNKTTHNIKDSEESKSQLIAHTELYFVADTIHDGGLCLLHPISIANEQGTILFYDSVEAYEPDSCKIFLTDYDNGQKGFIYLRKFDPCEDSCFLVIPTDGKQLFSRKFIQTDTLDIFLKEQIDFAD